MRVAEEPFALSGRGPRGSDHDPVRVVTDSQYLRQGVTQWMPRWKRNGWLTAARQPVKNQDLWERLDRALGEHEIEWRWVKGHAGHPENERADALANRGIPKG